MEENETIMSPLGQSMLEDADLIWAEKLVHNMTEEEKSAYAKIAKTLHDRKTSTDEKLAIIDEISGHNQKLIDNKALLKDIIESYNILLDYYDEIKKKISPRAQKFLQTLVDYVRDNPIKMASVHSKEAQKMFNGMFVFIIQSDEKTQEDIKAIFAGFEPKHKESGISKKFAEFYEKTQYAPMAFVLVL
ncbi:hypothetical protein WR25_21144 [Diploscapter pachys]|uniref:Uncharacterized protein n=1 Tax=Diploscapter pachys TaxID=2018661 RepID=A0A2A2L9D3_9BILA|nr:hypothetical protein WR25_21144 [Diploscapter pachys]